MPHYYSVVRVQSFAVNDRADRDDPSKWETPSNELASYTEAVTPEGASMHSYAMMDAIFDAIRPEEMKQKLTKAALAK